MIFIDTNIAIALRDNDLDTRERVRALGHVRRRTLDRLIAAQAMARNARLITRNGKDFPADRRAAFGRMGDACPRARSGLTETNSLASPRT